MIITAEPNTGSDATSSTTPATLVARSWFAVAFGAQRGGVGVRLDRGHVAERGERLRERAVSRSHLEDRAGQIRRSQLDDPVPVVLGVVERVERRGERGVNLDLFERSVGARVG